MKQAEFAEALGRAIAAGMVAAGLLETDAPAPRPTKGPAKPRRRRAQPSMRERPPADIRDRVDAALAEQRRAGAYTLDADEPEPSAEELVELEGMFARGEGRELTGRQLMALEKKLRLQPREEDRNAGTFDPDREENLAGHVTGRR